MSHFSSYLLSAGLCSAMLNLVDVGLGVCDADHSADCKAGAVPNYQHEHSQDKKYCSSK